MYNSKQPERLPEMVLERVAKLQPYDADWHMFAAQNPTTDAEFAKFLEQCAQSLLSRTSQQRPSSSCSVALRLRMWCRERRLTKVMRCHPSSAGLNEAIK